MNPVGLVRFRPDGLAARVIRLAGVLFATGVAEISPAGLAPLALDMSARATSDVSLRRSPSWKESPLAPKAARMVPVLWSAHPCIAMRRQQPGRDREGCGLSLD